MSVLVLVTTSSGAENDCSVCVGVWVCKRSLWW